MKRIENLPSSRKKGQSPLNNARKLTSSPSKNALGDREAQVNQKGAPIPVGIRRPKSEQGTTVRRSPLRFRPTVEMKRSDKTEHLEVGATSKEKPAQGRDRFGKLGRVARGVATKYRRHMDEVKDIQKSIGHDQWVTSVRRQKEVLEKRYGRGSRDGKKPSKVSTVVAPGDRVRANETIGRGNTITTYEEPQIEIPAVEVDDSQPGHVSTESTETITTHEEAQIDAPMVAKEPEGQEYRRQRDGGAKMVRRVNVGGEWRGEDTVPMKKDTARTSTTKELRPENKFVAPSAAYTNELQRFQNRSDFYRTVRINAATEQKPPHEVPVPQRYLRKLKAEKVSPLSSEAGAAAEAAREKLRAQDADTRATKAEALVLAEQFRPDFEKEEKARREQEDVLELTDRLPDEPRAKLRERAPVKEEDLLERYLGQERAAHLVQARKKLAQEEVRYNSRGRLSKTLEFVGLRSRGEPETLAAARHQHEAVRQEMLMRLRAEADEHFRKSKLRKAAVANQAAFEQGQEENKSWWQFWKKIEKNRGPGRRTAAEAEEIFKRRYEGRLVQQLVLLESRKLAEERAAALPSRRAGAFRKMASWYGRQNRYAKAAAGATILAAGGGASLTGGAILVGRALLGAAGGRFLGEFAAHSYSAWQNRAEKEKQEIAKLKFALQGAPIAEKDYLLKEIERRTARVERNEKIIRAVSTAGGAGAMAALTDLGVGSIAPGSPSAPEGFNEAQHQLDQSSLANPDTSPPTPPYHPEAPSVPAHPGEVPAAPENPIYGGVTIERGDSLWSTLAKTMHGHPDLDSLDLSPGQRMYIADGLSKTVKGALDSGNFEQLARWGLKPEEVLKGINQGANIGGTINYAGILKDPSLFGKFLSQAQHLSPEQISRLDIIASRLPYLK